MSWQDEITLPNDQDYKKFLSNIGKRKRKRKKYVIQTPKVDSNTFDWNRLKK